MKDLRLIIGLIILAAAASLIGYLYAAGDRFALQLQTHQSAQLTQVAELVRSDLPPETLNGQLQGAMTQFCGHTKPAGIAKFNTRYQNTLRACGRRQAILEQSKSAIISFHETGKYAKNLGNLKEAIAKLSRIDLQANQAIIATMLQNIHATQTPAALQKEHTELLASLEAVNVSSAQLAQAVRGYDQSKVDGAAASVNQSYQRLREALTATQTAIKAQEASFEQIIKS